MGKSKYQAALEIMSQEEVLEYLRLVDRRLYIMMNSGISWKPEYGPELEEVDARIAVLRQKIDTAHEARQEAICHAAAEGANTESLPCAGDGQETSVPEGSCCEGCPYLEILDGEVDCAAPDGVYGTDSVPCGGCPDFVDVPVPGVLLASVRDQYGEWCTFGCVKPCSNDGDILRVVLSLWVDGNHEHCQRLREIRSACENGGKTPVIYDENGHPYYATADGVRHYVN